MSEQEQNDTTQPFSNDAARAGLEAFKAFAEMTGGKIQAIRYVSPYGTQQIDSDTFTVIDEESETDIQEESIEEALRNRKIQLFKENQSKTIENLQQRILSLTESSSFEAQDVFILCEAIKTSLYILDNAEDCYSYA